MKNDSPINMTNTLAYINAGQYANVNNAERVF